MIIPPFLNHYKKKAIKNLLLFVCLLWGVLNLKAQTISNTRVNTLNNNIHFCLGSTYAVTFDTLGTTGSTFQAQLSDSSGTFSTLTANSTTSSATSTSLTIPFTAKLSNLYKLRIIRISPSSPTNGDTLSGLTITKPTPSFTFTNNNACAGTSVSFTNTSTGVSPFTCSYNFGTLASGAPAINTNCNPTVQFNPAVGGGTVTYTTSLTVTDAYGCGNSTSNTVSVKQRPDPRLDTTSLDYDLAKEMFINCSATRNSPNFSLLLSNSSYTSSSITNYSINWGDGSSNFSNSTFTFTSHLYTTLGLFNIVITTTNSLGCTAAKTYQFFNGNTPQGGLGYIGNVNDCVPFTLTWPVDTGGLNGTNQNAPGTTYLFHVSDSSADQSFTQANLPTTISHTFTKSSCVGTVSNAFTVTFTRINPCNSNPSSPGTVSASQKPIASFSVTTDTTICINTLTTLTNTSIGNYLNGSSCQTVFEKWWTITPNSGWTLNSGSLTPTLIPPFLQGSNVITATFTSTGIFTVKLKINKPGVISPARCTHDSITKTICVQPIPIPSFTLSQSPVGGCVNNVVTTINTSNTLSSCGTVQYNWSVRDSVTSSIVSLSAGRFNFVGSTNANSVSPVFNFTQKGRYKIRLTIVSPCAGTYIKDTFIIIKDKPVVTLKSDSTYCDSSRIAFNATNINHNPTYDSSYGTITAYNWNISPTGFIYLNGNSSSRNPVIAFPNNTSFPIIYRIIVTATNECGVSLPDTQYITINPKPIVTATSTPANSAFCSGGSTNIVLTNNLPSGVNYTWRAYASSVNITGAANQFTGVTGPIVQQLFNVGNTTQTVTYKIVGRQISASCSDDSISVVITVFPIPRVISTSQTICSGSATNLVLASTVSPSLFTWTTATTGATTGFSNQTTAITGPIAQTLTNNSTVTDTVRYTIRAIANGCNSIDTLIKVAVKPIPQISNTVITQSICSGVTASFTPTSTVLGSTFSYTASLFSGVATGFSSGNGNVSQTLFNTGLTNAIVRYAYTPSGGGTPNCIGSVVNFDVTVKPITSASANPTTAFLCSGAQTNIVLTPTISGTLYTWTAVLTSGTSTIGFSNNTIPTTGPIAQTITNSSTANAIVTYTITPVLNGCVGVTFTSVITVYPGTTPGTVGSAATVCSGSNSGTLTLTGSTGNVVRWESSVSPFSTWNNITNILTTQNYLNLTQSTRYRAVVQSGTGGSCSQVATNAVLITVDSITIAGNLTGTDTVCTGINSGVITLNNRRGNIVNWQSSVNLSSWSNIGTTTVNPYTFTNLTQTTWFRVSVKNGVCPFVNSDSVHIQVDALPSAAIAPDKQVCATSLSTGVNDNLVANTITSGTGLWSYISGPNSPTIVSPTNTTTVINNLAIGTHLIQWTVSNGKCPANKDTLYFTVYPPLVSTISSNQTICSGQIPNPLTGTTPTGGNGTYSFQWQQSSDSINWSNISGATSTNYQPGVLTINTYYRKVVTAGNCVVPSNHVLITIVPIIANTISANTSICFGTAAPTIVNNVATGGTGIYSYQWQQSPNGLTSWTNITNATLSNYSPGILFSTTYYRRLINSGPCSSTSNIVVITVNPLPIVNAGNDTSFCNQNINVQLSGFSPTSGGIGIWSGNSNVNSSGQFNPSLLGVGSFKLFYTFTNSSTGCVSLDSISVSIITPAQANAGNDTTVCLNSGTLTLIGIPSGGTWSGTNISSSGIFNTNTLGTFQLFYSIGSGS